MTTTTPAAISYEAAVAIAGAELSRILDLIEDDRPDDDADAMAWERHFDFNRMSQAAWSQMIWTLEQVYGVAYDDVEGALMAYL